MPHQLVSPKQCFGKTRVSYAPVASEWTEDVRLPWLTGGRITLPFRFEELEMYPLMGGEQFLVKHARRDDLFFGGTDEQPFLVELDPTLIIAFRRGGEDAFYESLKPSAIAELEAIFGEEGTIRQGDVYAFRLPIDWPDLYTVNRGVEKPLRSGDRLGRRKREMPVLHTRHVAAGWLHACFKRSVWTYHDGRAIALNGLVAEGCLFAPDHDPRPLRGSPHLLAVCEATKRRRLVATPHSQQWLGD